MVVLHKCKIIRTPLSSACKLKMNESQPKKLQCKSWELQICPRLPHGLFTLFRQAYKALGFDLVDLRMSLVVYRTSEFVREILCKFSKEKT